MKQSVRIIPSPGLQWNPINQMADIPRCELKGKLYRHVHTNEVIVCDGPGEFLRQSTNQKVNIALHELIRM